MVPKFTHRGFDVVPVPEHVFEKLLKVVEPALEDWDNMALEGKVDVIYGPLLPKFVNARGVEWEIIEDLKDMHEQWAGGIELRPTSAYGIRFYQNGSSLVMHHDKIHTHVISSIIHIAHEYDNDDEPWPIQIEDHFGNFHSVSLEPGQVSARWRGGDADAFESTDGSKVGLVRNLTIHWSPRRHPFTLYRCCFTRVPSACMAV